MMINITSSDIIRGLPLISKERNNNNRKLSRFNVYISYFFYKFKSLPFEENSEVVTGNKSSKEALEDKDSIDSFEYLVPQLA